jgi:Flp pilus assembly protein TadG
LGEEEGTALVELALVLPLLLVLMLGMVDFGKAFKSWIDETHLANQGARLASVGYSATVSGCNPVPNPNVCLTQYIQQGADFGELKSGSASVTQAKVCISYPTNPTTSTLGNVGDPVQVSVQSTYHWLDYLVNKRVTTLTTPFAGTATMRLERQAAAGATSAPGTKTCYPS